MSENDIKTLSSAQTFFMKVLFPPLWITLFGFGTLVMWLGTVHGKNGAPPPEAMKWAFLCILMAGAAFILWACAGLKRVRADANFLYVSNYLREISVPLTLVAEVTEIRWINIHPVTIHFRSATDFGQRVTFMPRTRLAAFGRSHPVVAELRQRAGLAPRDSSITARR